ncbi:MAG: PocR ligand-binding domain-containing protein [Candidatus Latescibacterota bacterium]|nr:MAG: PocR ligand-binding domain-containing protein [Candidatus Latescibacterota bacterium]
MATGFTDIAPMEKWVELAREVYDRFGCNAVTMDRDNNPVHPPPSWANQLCKQIKAHREGSKYICAVSQQNLAAEAKQLKESVIEECNGGFLKIVVPVFLGDEFVGTVGGCGLLDEEGEIDSLLIADTLGVSQEEIEDLLGDPKRVTNDEVDEMGSFIERRVGEILSSRAGS